MKVCIEPVYRGEDKGDGGIRRVVDAQRKYLPELGIEVVDTIKAADLVATHATISADVPVDKPWVTHCHGLYWSEYNWARGAHNLNRDVIRQLSYADHITVPSEWVGYVIKRGMWRNPTVLYHGVDVDDFTPRDSRGYILWNKNRPDPICDPAPVNTLAAQMPSQQFITTFGKPTDNVEVIGRTPYGLMKEIIADAGVYLCTTRETFGIGTLEAMAAGVPVVGWDWGGQREIIEHEVTGWLSPPGDFAHLEEGIEWAHENREKIGQRAREVVASQFTWRQCIERYAELYASLLTAKASLYNGPSVSVIVPCHNLARYLPAAVRSVQRQTLTDWEIIIVDDASPDETQQVANDLAASDDRIRVVTNERNLYLAGTLNKGISEAVGRYILPLDADNMIAPETLQALADALDSNRRVDIAYGAAKFVLEDGATPDPSVAPDGVSGWPRDFSYREQIQHRNQIPSTCMYRRTVWETTGGYRERCRTAEDADFWTRATSFGFKPVKVTAKTTLIYRQREDSMSRIEADWDWHAWFPWSRTLSLVPFAVPMTPPSRINNGTAWNVPSYEPRNVVIIIPVGPGHEKLVIDALDSVQAQDYQHWECVVYNDTGSPLSIPHPWAVVLNADGKLPPQGPAYGRNRAIEASNCALFVPLDADDYLQPDALSAFLSVYEQYGGVVYSQWYDDKGDGVLTYDPPEYDARLLTTKGGIHCVTALYPRSAWEELGGFDEDLSHWEDWEFQIGLASIGVCGTKVSKPLFTYRKTTGYRREGNITSFKAGKAAMLARWSDIWNRKDELMACRSCPGGGGAKYVRTPRAPVTQNNTLAHSQLGGRVMTAQPGVKLLEFQGASESTRTYVGQGSGKKYRFANSASNKVKYVHDEDAPGLLDKYEGGRPLFVEITQVQIETVQEQDVAEDAPPILEAQRVAMTDIPTLEAQRTPQADKDTNHEQTEARARVLGLGLAYATISMIPALIADFSVVELDVAELGEQVGRNRKGALALIQEAKDALQVSV